MTICEADPWRLQYFERADCPPDVNIPTEDSDAWLWFPDHRWVYDKVAIALSQGLDAGPHGVPPPRFPVFSKPDHQPKGQGAREPRPLLPGGIRGEPHARAYVDDALGWPPCQLGRGDRRGRAALVAPRHRRARPGGYLRLLDRARRARSRH